MTLLDQAIARRQGLWASYLLAVNANCRNRTRYQVNPRRALAYIEHLDAAIEAMLLEGMKKRSLA
jgi:hypothetical protein